MIDVLSKIFSCSLNAGATKIFGKHGTNFQFGGTPTLPCTDGLFALKTVPSLIMNQTLPTVARFSDLVKEYNTHDHKLLIIVLEQCESYLKFCAAVQGTHMDLPVVIKLRKSTTEILQSVGVR